MHPFCSARLLERGWEPLKNNGIRILIQVPCLRAYGIYGLLLSRYGEVRLLFSIPIQIGLRHTYDCLVHTPSLAESSAGIVSPYHKEMRHAL